MNFYLRTRIPEMLKRKASQAEKWNPRDTLKKYPYDKVGSIDLV